MRVTGIELHPVGSATAQALSFRNPGRAMSYNVKDITGLDADAIVSKYYGSSGSGNDQFYNLMIEKRDVVMRIGLNPEWANASYSELRDDLYKLISSSRTGLIDIWFMNESGVAAVLSGWVTKFESPQFVKSPEVLITVKTKDPMLKAFDPVTVSVVGLAPADTNIQDHVSSAPHGFDFTLTFTAAKATLIIGDPGDSSWTFKVTPAGGFLNGDVLHCSSDPNDKKLYVVRAGNTIYLADKIAAGSVWPIMFPGDNHFSLSTPTNIAWTAISYFPTFWGV
jgi:hypothetical protein